MGVLRLNWPARAKRGERSLEEEPIHGRADRRDSEGVRSGDSDAGAVPETRREPADVLPLEGEVRRDERERSAAVETVGRREPQTEADGCRPDAGQTGVAGGAVKKVVGPPVRTEAVAVARGAIHAHQNRSLSHVSVTNVLGQTGRLLYNFGQGMTRE